MKFFENLFNRGKTSAPIARDRLQILLAHERTASTRQNDVQDDLLAQLHEEILEVIKRHVAVDQDKVQIKLDRGAAYSTLEIDIEVPQLTEGDAVKKELDPLDNAVI